MSESTEVALTTETTAVAVLTDEAQQAEFLRKIREKTAELIPDVTTKKGRDEIKAMAFKVVKTRTFIDAARKRLTEEWRDKVKVADAAGKKIRDELEAIEEEVRRPLTEWEAAEKARAERAEQENEILRKHAVVLADETADDLATRLDALRGFRIDVEIHRDGVDIARNLRYAAITAVENGHKVAVEREENARELARLRAEQEAREAAEAEKRAAELAAKEEADRKAKAEADAKAAREAQEAAAKAAADKAAADAAEAARRAAQAEIDAANARAAEVERKAQAERDAAEAEKKRQADEKAAEEAAERRRQEDREHRRSLMSEAKVALMVVLEAGKDQTPEQVAVSIVRAVVGKEIPNMEFKF